MFTFTYHGHLQYVLGRGNSKWQRQKLLCTLTTSLTVAVLSIRVLSESPPTVSDVTWAERSLQESVSEVRQRLRRSRSQLPAVKVDCCCCGDVTD